MYDREHFPKRTTAYLLARRAQRIPDPVERLGFLRSSVARGGLGARRRFALCAVRRAALAAGLFFALVRSVSDGGSPVRALPTTPPSPRQDSLKVWLVEQTPGLELYSNGLRIENQFRTSGRPRLYQAIARAGSQTPAWRWRVDPAGIVFHSSESELAAFEPDQTGQLKRQGIGLLTYARRQSLYHFVIDRFGRVFRVVEEGGNAAHAGQSVWADSEWIYVNLNASFLGICFEARSGPAAGSQPLTATQAHAGRVLTEMLRSQYQIPAGNCVTHAQVSVNARNFRIGYHTDWAVGFPFQDLGLPDNYDQPLPSLGLFGFGFEPSFLESTSPGLRARLLRADEQIRLEAAARGVAPDRLRAVLNQRYQAALQLRAAEENKP
jgi:hypothetical protein